MSKLFPAADVDADSIAAVINFAPKFAGTTAPTGHVGFYLIKGTLVPYRFLGDLEFELTYKRLNCFEVTKISDLLEEIYLASLSESELDVLGECVLLLIDEGRVPFSLIDPKEAA